MLNPQQQAFKEAYLNPESETFGNQTQSALKAGYTQEYAESIGCKENMWMAEIVGDLELIKKAEKVLKEMLDLPTEEASFAKIKQDTAKFVSERLGKFGDKKQIDLTTKGEKLESGVTPAQQAILNKYEEEMKKSLT
jgi:phage terminase small subunit